MLDSIYQVTLVLLNNFWRENVNIYPSFTQHGCNYVTLLNLWFIEFIA